MGDVPYLRATALGAFHNSKLSPPGYANVHVDFFTVLFRALVSLYMWFRLDGSTWLHPAVDMERCTQRGVSAGNQVSTPAVRVPSSPASV